jgi:adenylate cyclase
MIPEHPGRVGNTAGDSVLAEFPSLAEPLSCALAVQQAIANYKVELSPDPRILFRIGVHVGDIITKDGDLFGDAVNIAARLRRWPSRATFVSRQGARAWGGAFLRH